MKKLSCIFIIGFVLLQIASGATPDRKVETLSDSEYKTLFNEGDVNSSGSLVGSEVHDAVARTVAALFRANNVIFLLILELNLLVFRRRGNDSSHCQTFSEGQC